MPGPGISGKRPKKLSKNEEVWQRRREVINCASYIFAQGLTGGLAVRLGTALERLAEVDPAGIGMHSPYWIANSD
jgi:hypothetical protein